MIIATITLYTDKRKRRREARQRKKKGEEEEGNKEAREFLIREERRRRERRERERIRDIVRMEFRERRREDERRSRQRYRVRQAYVTILWNAIIARGLSCRLIMACSSSPGKTEVIVLKIGKSYEYTIPSFSAITLQLKHVTIRIEEESGPGFNDVFFNEGPVPECPEFTAVLPKQAFITHGCLINVSCSKIILIVTIGKEFQYGVSDTLNIETLPDDTIFVAYKWHWSAGDHQEKYDESNAYYEDELDVDFDIDFDHDDDEEQDTVDSSLITHTVTFKCIGATRDNSHQTALQAAFESIQEGHDVLVQSQIIQKTQMQ